MSNYFYSLHAILARHLMDPRGGYWTTVTFEQLADEENQ